MKKDGIVDWNKPPKLIRYFNKILIMMLNYITSVNYMCAVLFWWWLSFAYFVLRLYVSSTTDIFYEVILDYL